MENSQNEIFFNFSYFALKLLGKGLYSNAWTAIAELVANSLDAKAKQVYILLDMSDKEHATIEIFDNGFGMDYRDISEKYVLIGKDKRLDPNLDDALRNTVMGRKGIGKLAALYLSKQYYLVTKAPNESSAWCLDTVGTNESDIPSLTRVKQSDLYLSCKKHWDKIDTGTLIKLIDVDLTHVGSQTIEGIKARLADFYQLDALSGEMHVAVITEKQSEVEFVKIEKSIAFKNFYALFDNTDLRIKDKMKSHVFLASSIPEISERKKETLQLDDVFNCTGTHRFVRGDGEISDEMTYQLKGGIAIHATIDKTEAHRNDPLFLKNKAYKPTQLRLYVRNKLAVENFMTYIQNTQAFANYIEGEISFDILDDNNLDDIATSNRQGLSEEDERVGLLVSILKPIITNLISKRVKIGNDIRSEENDYREEAARQAKQDAEAVAKQLAQDKVELSRNLDLKEVQLAQEKSRTHFLTKTISPNQISYSKRFHMVKTNNYTIQTIIQSASMKYARNRLTFDEMWQGFAKISLHTQRINALLSLSDLANFDMQEEYIHGDLYQFIAEYCEEIFGQTMNLNIETQIVDNHSCIKRFSPQDIAVILDNVVSNSSKHGSSNLEITMRKDASGHCTITFRDDGRGIDKAAVGMTEELFEFGKSYTPGGTGVGLYHIKNIVEKKLNGYAIINENVVKGFELQVCFNEI